MIKETSEQKNRRLINKLQKHKEKLYEEQIKQEYIEQRAMQYYNTIMAATHGDITLAIHTLQYRMKNSKNIQNSMEIAAMMKAVSMLQWEREKAHDEFISPDDDDAIAWDCYGNLLTQINKLYPEKTI